MGVYQDAEEWQMAETSVLPRQGEATASEVTPGEMLGSYRVLKKLGAGGMGAVYLAEHALIGRKVAIKVLLPHVSYNDEIVQRFFNEARIASALDHPGIIQVFDFGYRSDGRAYLVMEFLDGEALGTRLERRGRLPLDESLRIVHQCAGALSVAHRRGVIHRDIKPDNIIMIPDPLVDGGERAKLLDFGIAKLTGPERGGLMTRAGAIMGTPIYMAPEQCSGASDVDHRADIYALGCVLFHLVCGRPPFTGAGSGDIMAAHMREPAPVPSAFVPGIPAEVDAIVARCLAKSPDERFATMAELDAAIALAAPAVAPQVAAASAPTMAAGRIMSAPPSFTPAFTPANLTPPGLTPPGLTPPGLTPPGLTPPGLAPALTPTPSQPLSSPGPASPLTTLGGATGQSQPARSPRLVRKALLPAAVIAAAAVVGLVLFIGNRQPSLETPATTSAAAGGPVTANDSPAPSAAQRGPDSDRSAVPSGVPGPAAASEITVRIESLPPGASVFLPGSSEPVGVTPYEYRTAARADPLTVRLELDGYHTTEATFDLDQSRVVTAVLNELAHDTQRDAGQPSERPRRQDRTPRPRKPDNELLDYR